MRDHIGMLKVNIRPLRVEYDNTHDPQWLIMYKEHVVAECETPTEAYRWAMKNARFYRDKEVRNGQERLH